MEKIYSSFKENNTPVFWKRYNLRNKEVIEFLLPELSAEEVTAYTQDSFVKLEVNKSGEYWFNIESLPVIYLQSHYDEKNITAHMKRGLLTIEIPYTEEYQLFLSYREELKFVKNINKVSKAFEELRKRYEH